MLAAALCEHGEEACAEVACTAAANEIDAGASLTDCTVEACPVAGAGRCNSTSSMAATSRARRKAASTVSGLAVRI